MNLPDATINALFALRDADPAHEICGVVAEDNQVYPFTNIATAKDGCFIFAPEQWLYFKGLGIPIKAIYHSHPDNSIEPSEADLTCLKRHQVPGLIITADVIEVIDYAD